MIMHFVILSLLAILLYLWLGRVLKKGILLQGNDYQQLVLQQRNVFKDSEKLQAQSRLLEESSEKTIALYEITKEICRSLEEEKLFASFKQNISRFAVIKDCKLPESDLMQYQDHTVLPLCLQKKTIGFLAVSGIRMQDADIFHILAQQFLLGLKRALLYKEVQELTITDGLTKVFTRRYFMERFAEELNRSKKFKHTFSFLMVDIDRFNEFNDRYGHLVGDAILREVTKSIKESVRQVDFIGRYGGEELSIVLTETSKDQAYLAAERIRQSIASRHIKVYDEDLRVTISIGVAMFPADAFTVQTLIEKADSALYFAKETGRNKTCLFETRQ